MSRYALLRVTDSFFRHRFLYLLPLVLLTGVGVFVAGTTANTYQSRAALYVESQTLLANLTQARGIGGATYQSPSSLMSEQMTLLLRTDSFTQKVLRGAGVGELFDERPTTLQAIEATVVASSEGNNLVHVTASASDPGLAFRLAGSMVASFTQWVIDANVAESTSAKKFLDELVMQYRAEVKVARDALNKFVQSNGNETSTAFQVELSRLSSAVTAAEARLNDTLSKSEDARLATAQTTSDVKQRLRVVDSPTVPLSPQPSRKKDIVAVALFGFLGALLSGLAIAAGVMMDRSFRYEGDVVRRLRLPVLAVLPEATSGKRRSTPRRPRSRASR